MLQLIPGYRPLANSSVNTWRRCPKLISVRVPEILSAQVPEILAGSCGPDEARSSVSSGSGSSLSDALELEESMCADAKRRDVQLLLPAGVPQERIHELTDVSVRTIRRIRREAARREPARGGPHESSRTARPWPRSWPRRPS